MDAINDLVLAAAASPWLLLVMFAVAVVDGFFPPVPSETVLVAAAAAAASTGAFATIVLLCLVAAAGAIIGDNIAYTIGRRTGTSRFRWMRAPAVASVLTRARQALDRRGASLILGARYIPVGRVAVNMSAGALGYPWRRFALVCLAAGTSWAVYGGAIGVFAGHWLAGQPFLSAALGTVLAVLIGVAIDRIAAQRRRRGAEAPSEGARVPAGPATLDR